MADATFPFQPGVMLHDAIVGAFRASGTTFEAWCNQHGINPSNARNTTCGINKGPKGQAMLARMIAAAGPPIVEAGYLARLEQHIAKVNERVA